jgi:hypothetical protein
MECMCARLDPVSTTPFFYPFFLFLSFLLLPWWQDHHLNFAGATHR